MKLSIRELKLMGMILYYKKKKVKIQKYKTPS